MIIGFFPSILSYLILSDLILSYLIVPYRWVFLFHTGTDCKPREARRSKASQSMESWSTWTNSASLVRVDSGMLSGSLFSKKLVTVLLIGAVISSVAVSVSPGFNVVILKRSRMGVSCDLLILKVLVGGGSRCCNSSNSWRIGRRSFSC